MDINVNLQKIAENAKKASYKLASLTEELKNKTLLLIAKQVEENKEFIFEENKKDLEEAQKLLDNGELSKPLYDRLKLDDDKFKAIIQGFKDVIKLEDPINQTLWAMEIDKGLELYKVSCPIGVIGVIFESRPDVIPQIVALAIKSANAVILKGGIEALKTNEAFIKVINEALGQIPEFPENAINLIRTREDVNEMLKMDDYIDLIIPRGSNKLVKFIQSNTKIPVLGHTEGICHIYIDESADIEKVIKVCIDAKIQYPSACNAVETILVDAKAADSILPVLIKALQNAEVLVKGDEKTKNIVENVESATEEDWKTEYGDKIVSIKEVEDIYDAINHINTYGSGHTDCILSENSQNVKIFMNLVDSSGVYHNVSTRFSDGFRYGLGAEVGISTNKTHSRGPVGLEGLTIYKYKLFGNGQTVTEYTGENAKSFTHKRIK